MNRDLITAEALFAGQLLGTVVFVIGLFQGGLTPLALAGGAIIVLSIVGLASTAFATEARIQPGGDPVHRDGDADRDRGRGRLSLGRGSK